MCLPELPSEVIEAQLGLAAAVERVLTVHRSSKLLDGDSTAALVEKCVQQLQGAQVKQSGHMLPRVVCYMPAALGSCWNAADAVRAGCEGAAAPLMQALVARHGHNEAILCANVERWLVCHWLHV
jgi:hypothetical protein